MTAPMTPPNPEAGDPHHRASVGGTIRPPRLMTIGRRRSDRVFIYMAIGLMVFMMVFILYTSWQQNRSNNELERSEQERSLILQRVECLAANTGEFEEAVAEYLVAVSQSRSEQDPRTLAALGRLQRLQTDRQLNSPAAPERCNLGTTTTTR